MGLRKPKDKQPKPNNAEIQRLAKLQGVKPFNFDEALGEGSKLWSNGEFNEFENWLKDTRIADTIRENSK